MRKAHFQIIYTVYNTTLYDALITLMLQLAKVVLVLNTLYSGGYLYL